MLGHAAGIRRAVSMATTEYLTVTHAMPEEEILHGLYFEALIHFL